jgi:bifunctional enzyme CysN/CysC
MMHIRQAVVEGGRGLRWVTGKRSWQARFAHVTSAERAMRFGHDPITVLLTGLPGSGKSTIARALERHLFDKGRAVVVLDHAEPPAPCPDDWFRRAITTAKVLNDSGLICICAVPALTAAVRQGAQAAVEPHRLVEIYLSAPPATCRTRTSDVASWEALGGDRYEAPALPDLTLPTHLWHVSASVDALMRHLHKHNVFR